MCSSSGSGGGTVVVVEDEKERNSGRRMRRESRGGVGAERRKIRREKVKERGKGRKGDRQVGSISSESTQVFFVSLGCLISLLNLHPGTRKIQPVASQPTNHPTTSQSPPSQPSSPHLHYHHHQQQQPNHPTIQTH